MTNPNNNWSPSKKIAVILSDESEGSSVVPMCRAIGEYPSTNFEAIESLGIRITEDQALTASEICERSNDAGQESKQKKKNIVRKMKRRRVKQMIGFGVPNHIMKVQRSIPVRGMGPPYFYFENVAGAPKEVWPTMSKHLYDIIPEFVESIHFCVAARKRGYIHNLPILKRFQILPLPPLTIQEAIPFKKHWWPKWDKRKKFNCLVINNGCPKYLKEITAKLDNYGPHPPEHIKKAVLKQCKRFNFIWDGKNKVHRLEPNEIEAIMGYPLNHTSIVCKTTQYPCLGNAFQVDTVGYHLSLLRELFPHGIKVLSLFSGIGGAEVALHRLGIRLNIVVSVESSDACQKILKSWWEKSNQLGKLIDIIDVKSVTFDKLKKLMATYGYFDLVIGGSPCNNFSGNNRDTRNGFDGERSSLFFDYCRILDHVKYLTR